MKEEARSSFGNGGRSSPEPNPFSGFGGSPANQDVPKPGLSIDRVEDLVVDLGNGCEESIAYRLYTGTSMIRAGEILVLRFHDRWVFVEGKRLRPVRDAVANKRCANLRISSRVETLEADKESGAVVTAVRVVKPKRGNNELAMLMEGRSPLEAAVEAQQDLNLG